ncbi:MAG TPA: mevalonate kinase [Candidatus Diapherotrites archaeon]|uniref:Mevalonate kinase n=1 Tax=Candidatus Iainarchaeum sp. TaxID=3101447 RepID=A0A7J4IXU7_9ARCH|nr:mevalonate kinase [Candidatus Diapherotrites archaeon]
MVAGKGVGFGKTILFGEHFVVYGLPAIASAISGHTLATVEGGKNGIEFVDKRPQVEGYKETKKGEIAREIDALVKYFKIDPAKTPLKITLAGNLVCASGVGASAALASSVARALNEHFCLKMNDEKINEAAYEAEAAGSGTPSGIDNTCSTYGGMISFQKGLKGGKNKITLLEVKKPLFIVMASSGITQETKGVVADVRAQREKEPQKYEKIFSEYTALFGKALEAVKKGNERKVGALMDKNMELLRQINVSCKEIEGIISAAKKGGALGAKLTGTGRGGLAICLAADKKGAEKIAAAVKKGGYEATVTQVGGKAK